MDAAGHHDILSLFKDSIHHPFRLLVFAFLLWGLVLQFRKGKQAKERGEPIPLDAMTPRLFMMTLGSVAGLFAISGGICWLGYRLLGEARFGWVLAFSFVPWLIAVTLYMRYYLARRRALSQ
jgi:hypothetical protein